MDSSDMLSESRKHNYEFEQALISKKDKHNAFSVERNFINSKAYHDKFLKLPVSKNVQEVLYEQAGRLLEFVDNLEGDRNEEERLVAINSRTGELIVDNFERAGSPKGTGFSIEERKLIENCPDSIVLLHNHSHNGRPSGQDLLSYLHNEQIKISLILCHDGSVFGIYGVKEDFEPMYKDFLEHYKEKTSDIDEAKRLATTEMYIKNDDLSDKHKIFCIKCL